MSAGSGVSSPEGASCWSGARCAGREQGPAGSMPVLSEGDAGQGCAAGGGALRPGKRRVKDCSVWRDGTVFASYM